MCYSQLFLTKLLALGVLFPTAVRAVRAVVLVKSEILGISSWTSFILALRVVVVAK